MASDFVDEAFDQFIVQWQQTSQSIVQDLAAAATSATAVESNEDTLAWFLQDARNRSPADALKVLSTAVASTSTRSRAQSKVDRRKEWLLASHLVARLYCETIRVLMNASFSVARDVYFWQRLVGFQNSGYSLVYYGLSSNFFLFTRI
jgi:hypothetical protein